MVGSGHLRKISRKLLSFFIHNTVILMYHRVSDEQDYPFPIRVAIDNFAQQLDYIKHKCQPLSLLDMVDELRRGKIPDRGVVLTFDDGYADNLENVHPLIEEYQIPITVFVTSSFINSPQGFWWDKLSRMILQSSQLSTPYLLTIQGRTLEFATDTPDERLELFTELHTIMKGLSPAERDGLFLQIAELQNSGQSDSAPWRPLTCSELQTLAASPLVEIGAHTQTHPALAMLNRETQTGEITGSRERLREITGLPISSFSYPFGSHNDFNADSIKIVQESGFTTACMVGEKNVSLSSDPFALPRRWVGDWNKEQFSFHLENWLHSVEG